jgi:hypothetical protein
MGSITILSSLNIKKSIKKHLIAIIVLLIYFSPFFIGDSRHLVHDNLDSNIVWYSNLVKSGELYSSNDTDINIALGSIPRGCYPSEFYIPVQLFNTFKPYTAYAINFILIHVIAYIGFYLLISRFILKDKGQEAIMLALAFSLVPFWPSAGLSIAGQPLILYCLLMLLYNQKSTFYFIPFIFVPLYCSFYFSGIYFFPIYGIIILNYIYRERRIPFIPIIALIVFYSIGVLMEYRLILMEYSHNFQDHRQLFVKNEFAFGHWGLIRETLYVLFYGQYHMQGLQLFFAPVILIFVIFRISKINRVMIFLFSFCLFYSFLYIIPNYGPIRRFEFFNDMNLRWIVILPIFWYLLLAFTINNMNVTNQFYSRKIKQLILVFVIFNNLLFIFPINLKGVFNYLENPFLYTYFENKKFTHRTFNEFYRIDEFESLEKQIRFDKNKYSIAISSLGSDSAFRFVPEILQYNDFKTLDAYFYYFSIERKNLIFDITKNELLKSKNESLKRRNFYDYFVNWGSRCYFYSDDLNNNYDTIFSLSYNFELLKKSNCEYIFSPIPIEIEELRLIYYSPSNEKINRMYLYKLE